MNKLTHKENCQENRKKKPYTFQLQARDTRLLLLACVCVIRKLSDNPRWWLFLKKLENENFLSHLPRQVEFFIFLKLWQRGNLKKIMMFLIGQHYMYEWSNAKSKMYFWHHRQASPELAEIITQMITNHGPLVKARPSAAVVGIPFKRQGSLDGGQLPSSLSSQVVNIYFSRTTSI